jgi:cation/acetate symporter
MSAHLATTIAATKIGNPTINIAIFGLFVVATLAIVIRASRNNRSAADYYAGGRSFAGPQNGIAIQATTCRFTMADVLSFRLKQRPVRMAAATSTLIVSFFYLLAQTAGAGGLVALLLGISSRAGQSIVITVVGVVRSRRLRLGYQAWQGESGR